MAAGDPEVDLPLSFVFWKLVKSIGVVDATKAQNSNSPNAKKRKSAIFTYDEVQEFHEKSDLVTKPWSEQATELKMFLYEEKHKLKNKFKPRKGVPVEKRGHQFIYNFFRSLDMSELDLTEIDANTGRFESLTDLNLSGNSLRSLANLPPSLTVLNAYTNYITSIASQSPAPLRHLGLGYNEIASVNDLLQFAPTLVSLDLSYNSLISLEDTLLCLMKFPNLKILSLQGNPLCLAKGYQVAVLNRLPNITMLDGVEVPKTPLKPAAPKVVEEEKPTTGRRSSRNKKEKEKEKEKAKAKEMAEQAEKAALEAVQEEITKTDRKSVV